MLARIKRHTDRTLLIEEDVEGYQSIALETLYNFGFGTVLIGRIVRPQMKENGAWVGIVSSGIVGFAAERSTGSIPTQKTFDRSFEGLSNGIGQH